MSFPAVREYRIDEAGNMIPHVMQHGVRVPVAFAFLPGSQCIYAADQTTPILLYEGARGACGKSLCATMSAISHVGQGLGPALKILWLRRSYPELAEAVAIGKTWIPKVFPDANFIKQPVAKWEFRDGEEFIYSFVDSEDDFARHHGQQYQIIIMDEITLWPDLSVMKLMLSCLRSGHPRAPKIMRCLTNSWGPGRDAVKTFFQLPLQPGVKAGPLIGGDDAPTYDEEGNREPARRTIHGLLSENLILQNADPDYITRILGSTDDPGKKRAWSLGEWTEPSSNMFGDIFVHRRYIEVPTFRVPTPNKIRLSLDHGSADDASVLFFWEANGDDILMPNGKRRSTKRHDLFIVGEVYIKGGGTRGKNLTVEMIVDRIFAYIVERGWPPDIVRRQGNIADSAIWSEDGRPSIASDYEKLGISLDKAIKHGEGGRVQGIAQARKWLLGCVPKDGVRETNGLFVCDCCVEWWKHIPNLQRDKNNLEDVATRGQKDHDWDATRYYLTRETDTGFMYIGTLRGLSAHRNIYR